MEYWIYMAGVMILCGIGSFLAGVLVGTNRLGKAIEKGCVGNLRIDRSEPDEPPKAFLEIAKGYSIDEISQFTVVMLRVVNEDYISCE